MKNLLICSNSFFINFPLHNYNIFAFVHFYSRKPYKFYGGTAENMILLLPAK